MDLVLTEAIDLRNFYQVRLEHLEARFKDGVGDLPDILEHETLAIRVSELHVKIEELMLRSIKKPFLKRLFRK